ncbi:MAG: aminomethyl-transferring glycine dehydrogenase subunit GcvPA [bacterium]
MAYIPNTDEERKLMLKKIGVNSFEELISNIPEQIRFEKSLNLPPQMSEFEVIKHIRGLAEKNVNSSSHISFLGGGAYDHFIPSIVFSVLEKPEFKTAYTPYQAEVSQGTLQAMYEFQSMICALTGMEVSNASMYDGASALAEACLMSNAQNRKTEILIAGTLNPNYRKVLETTCRGRKIIFKECVLDDGTCDFGMLKNSITENTSGVIVQQPNAYGNLEDVIEIEKIAHSKDLMFIVSFDPISLGLLLTPGEYNADIAVAEGQPLGIPLNYGGPYLGLFTAKQKFVRKMPGRLSGVTKDSDGNRGYVLTLQTREQQIKREKATSNICTNQGLFMLAATVYMSTMGKQGIKEVAEQSFHKAHYLAKNIQNITGFSLLNDKPFFREFLVKTPILPGEIIKKGEEQGFLAGVDTYRFPECKKGLLIAVTEKRTKAEMDSFIEFLRQFAK